MLMPHDADSLFVIAPIDGAALVAEMPCGPKLAIVKCLACRLHLLAVGDKGQGRPVRPGVSLPQGKALLPEITVAEGGVQEDVIDRKSVV